MTPAAAAAPHTTPRPICRISRNSQKRRKTQDAFNSRISHNFSEKTQDSEHKKLYYVNGGIQERKCDFIKIFFHLYVNGKTRERRYNFIKIFSHL